MKREEKEADKNEEFLKRFRELYDQNYRTQEKLGLEVGASRPTVSEWLSGKRTPNIHQLKKMAQLFDVSTDYLLGLSDKKSPDASARAAATYTGLSDEAVEALHCGLDNQMRGLSEEERERRLGLASELIRSEAFAKMLYDLGEIMEEAHVKKTLKILREQHLGYRFINRAYYPIDPVNRDVVIPTLMYILGDPSDKLNAMSDKELQIYVTNGEGMAAEHCDRYQYHAAKAFAGYIDQVVKGGCEKAEWRLEEKGPPMFQR